MAVNAGAKVIVTTRSRDQFSMLEALGEAFALVHKSEVDEYQFLEIVNAVFSSPVYANYGRIIAEKKFGRRPPASRYSADMSKHAFFGTDKLLKRNNQEYARKL